MQSIKTGSELNKSIKLGVNTIGDIVKSTLGPAGLNGIYKGPQGLGPVITNDGISLAREIDLEDKISQLAVDTLVDVADKTDIDAGDSTTTSVTLSQAIYNTYSNDGDSLVSRKRSPIEIQKEISIFKDKVVEALNKSAKKVKSKKDLENIAITSMQDEKIGSIIADMVHQIGVDGNISVTETYNRDISTEVIKGMSAHTKFCHPSMSNQANGKELRYNDVNILVTNQKIISDNQLLPAISECIKNNIASLVVVASDFDSNIINSILRTRNSNRSPFNIIGIKAPGLTDDEFKDLAMFVGADLFDNESIYKLETAIFSNLGHIDSIYSKEGETSFVGGKGENNEELKDRIKGIKERIEKEETEIKKNILKRRIASLSGAVGIIRVGADTDSQRSYLKRKIDDAKFATINAAREGYVKGGGLALKEIADNGDYTEDEKKILYSCYETIQNNAGGKIDIPDTAIDPLIGIRSAFKNACSGASQLLTVGVAFGEETKSLVDELEVILNKLNSADKQSQSL